MKEINKPSCASALVVAEATFQGLRVKLWNMSMSSRLVLSV